MNALFHLAAFITTILLVYWLLSSWRQRDFLKELMGSVASVGQGHQPRVYVDTPEKFLGRFGRALDLPIQMEASREWALRRISPGPFVELYLQHGLKALKLTDVQMQDGLRLGVELGVLSMPETALAARLTPALGEGVIVTCQLVESQTR